MREDKDRAAKLEELRFAKRQQWSIATSAVTLLAAVFGIAHVIKPKLGEKIAATVLVVVIVVFACIFLWQLQGHLEKTRKLLDPRDRSSNKVDGLASLVRGYIAGRVTGPWYRGVDILTVLAGTVFAAGLVVLYYLWCHVQ